MPALLNAPLRRFLAALLLSLAALPLRAAEPPVEGMWIPLLLEKYNIDEMKAMGFELDAEDIYSAEHPSLKDAVVSFGGFCTGAVVSNRGLVITNHHCGYRAIQSHSTVENDYLKNGFWAADTSEEKPNPDLSVTFVRRIEEVSEQVLAKLSPDMEAAEREQAVKTAGDELVAKATRGTHFEGYVKPFFKGNRYFLFITETFPDVRLVGAPPSGIGKFGGDVDNWMWPRHSGDFSVFRIYAGPDNEPAPYSEDNRPYRPRKHFQVSTAGVEPGDFTMVFGFPGRTEQYLPSQAVAQRQTITNPIRIRLRGKRIEVMNRYMDQNDTLRLMYAAKQSGISNGWKKWIGQNKGLKRLNAIGQKQAFELRFSQWVARNEQREAAYGHLLPSFEEQYEKLRENEHAYQYFLEGLYAIEALKFANAFTPLLRPDELSGEKAASLLSQLREQTAKHFDSYHAPIDREIAAMMMEEYFEHTDGKYHPAVAQKELGPAGKRDYQAYADALFAESYFTNGGKLTALLQEKPKKIRNALLDDPLWQLTHQAIEIYRESIYPTRTSIQAEIDALNPTWMKAILEMKEDQRLYPDANSTMRVGYGQVKRYEPRDGVIYKTYTTMEGIMLKKDTASRWFQVPPKLEELYEQRDFGPYAREDGRMPVCFIATNHTTGGNSGSPVLNARGQLIGLNFDRNWEGTMSDIIYDKSLVRNITVDIRYVLFVIDKLASAGHLVEEMERVD